MDKINNFHCICPSSTRGSFCEEGEHDDVTWILSFVIILVSTDEGCMTETFYKFLIFYQF